MKQPSEVIRWLYDFGYFYAPEALAITRVDPADLGTLTLNDAVVVAAVSALQRTDSNFAPLAAAAHPGDPDFIAPPDGDVCPATLEMMDLPRCGCLMFPDPDTGSVAAASHPFDSPPLALDRGSWDTGCVSEYPDKHAIIVAWSGLNLLKSPIKENFDAVWNAAVVAQAQVGLIVVRDDNHPDPHIRASVSRDMPGGAIGYAQVPNNPGCGTQVWGRVNPDYAPANWRDTWPALITHELFGHNSGQSHTSGGIMNPSIRNIPWQGWTNDDPGKPRQVGWFGGPVTPVPPPPPTPEPPSEIPAPGMPLGERFQMYNGVWAQLYRTIAG